VACAHVRVVGGVITDFAVQNELPVYRSGPGFSGDYDDLTNKPTLGGAAALNVGATAGTVAAGDDSRLSDARTPTTHASTHATAGSDPVTPAAIGAAADADVVKLTGAQTVAGVKTLSSQAVLPAGARIAVPAGFWSSVNSAYFSPQGGFGSNGNHAMDFFSNGYRDSSAQWTSLGAGGNLGAGILSFTPINGNIVFRASNNWPTGSAINPPDRLIVYGNGDGALLDAGSLRMGAFGNIVITSARHHQLRSYTVGTLPAATTAAQMIHVSNETGGAVPAFSDGTNWRRVTDRAIVS